MMDWRVVAVFPLMVFVGCWSETQMSENIIVDARTSYEQSIETFKQKNFEASIPLLTQALDGGLVNVEIIDVLLMRAKCYMATQEMSLALADLESAERGVEETSQMAEVHALLSLYYRKSGNVAKSESELQKAQTIDPNILPATL